MFRIAFIGNIGGVLGLSIGASCVTIVEVNKTKHTPCTHRNAMVLFSDGNSEQVVPGAGKYAFLKIDFKFALPMI